MQICGLSLLGEGPQKISVFFEKGIDKSPGLWYYLSCAEVSVAATSEYGGIAQLGGHIIR